MYFPLCRTAPRPIAMSHNTNRACPVSCQCGMLRMVLTLGAARCGVKPLEASIWREDVSPWRLGLAVVWIPHVTVHEELETLLAARRRRRLEAQDPFVVCDFVAVPPPRCLREARRIEGQLLLGWHAMPESARGIA